MSTYVLKHVCQDLVYLDSSNTMHRLAETPLSHFHPPTLINKRRIHDRLCTPYRTLKGVCKYDVGIDVKNHCTYRVHICNALVLRTPVSCMMHLSQHPRKHACATAHPLVFRKNRTVSKATRLFLVSNQSYINKCY